MGAGGDDHASAGGQAGQGGVHGGVGGEVGDAAEWVQGVFEGEDGVRSEVDGVGGQEKGIGVFAHNGRCWYYLKSGALEQPPLKFIMYSLFFICLVDSYQHWGLVPSHNIVAN